MIEAGTPDPEQRRLAFQLGLRSAMVVPLVVGKQAIGTLSFVTAESGRLYGTQDLILATEKPEECRRQLEYLPFQTIKGSRAGFLRRAIETEGGYGEPPEYREKRVEQERAAQKMTRQEVEDARRAAIMELLIGMADALIAESSTGILDPLLEYMRAHRERSLKMFKPGSKPYEAIASGYESEARQLELIVEFYAQNPCPRSELFEFIQQHGPDPLKNLIREHYERD